MTSKRAAASSGGPRVRPAGPDDLERIEWIEGASFAQPWGADELAGRLAPGSAAFVVEASHDGVEPPTVAGYALFALVEGEAELLQIAVATRFRGRGLAGRLLADALAALERGGHVICHLEVRAGNRPAIALYERLSFAGVGCRRGYYADGEDALVFRRDAAPSGG